MCGISGFAFSSHQGNELESVARDMVTTLSHRGPDDTGLWTCQQAGLGFGQQRLSIIDLSEAGHQPMLSHCGRFVLTYNGEIYNHKELRRQLEQRCGTIPWRGHSDTETLVSCFAEFGVEATLERISGMFALALWDRQERRLTLARDRFGEKPLYYGRVGQSLIFASEVRALKAFPSWSPEIDPEALELYVKYNYVPAPYSIYRGIQKLPAGSFLQFEQGLLDSGPQYYWSVNHLAESSNILTDVSESELLESLDQKLRRAVASQMISDVPLGALLSGGIDSSLVCALMQAQSNSPIKTFTIGFEDQAYNEANHASAVAHQLGADHTELILKPEDALNLIPEMAQVYDEPFADSSQLPTRLVMELAKSSVKVALSGDGGDEIFGGYNRYRAIPQIWRYTGWMPGSLRTGFGKALGAAPGHARFMSVLSRSLGVAQLDHKLHKLGQRLSSATSMDELYLLMVSEWNEASPTRYSGVSGEYRNLLACTDRWPQVDGIQPRMMALDAQTYMPDDILVKVDRAAMSVSLETRAPFLDRELVEFAWQLPMNMKIRGDTGKWALHQILGRYLDPELFSRPKMGFSIPLDDWLRGPLREWAEGLLAETRLREDGFFNPNVVRSIWDEHCQGNQSHGNRLWSILMFQDWMDKNG